MLENPYSGMFIVFEGIDGAGKSTQARKLFAFLQRFTSVEPTKEPSYMLPVGNRLRKALCGQIEIDNIALQELFVQDRTEHIYHFIIPRIGKGTCVICDRYFLSTVAYGSLDTDTDTLLNMHQIIPDMILPDITFIIDVDPAITLKRQRAVHGELDIFEKEEKLTRVRNTYRELARRFDNVYVIDGNRDEDVVFEDIKNLLMPIMRQRGVFIPTEEHAKKKVRITRK